MTKIFGKGAAKDGFVRLRCIIWPCPVEMADNRAQR